MSDRDTKAKEYDAVVSGLRDEPCAFKRQCFRDGWDAAIAALPDMVKPLEFSGPVTSMTARTPFGEYLVEKDGEYGWGFWSPGMDIDYDPKGGFHPSPEAAKAAVQAHRIAAILSALGVQGGEA